jgi:predicted lipoprotein
MGRKRRFDPLRIVGALALVALVLAMALSTRFVTRDELASMGPTAFSPEATADELFAEANETLPREATPLAELLTGLQKDIAGTAEELGAARPDETTYLFPVSGEAKVVSRQQQAIEVTVDAVPSQTQLNVAVGPGLNGTLLRDALGFTFGDAPNQSAYQQVGDSLKVLVQKQIGPALGDRTEAGTSLRFVGVVSVTDTGVPQSPAKPVSIQPLTLEVVR